MRIILFISILFLSLLSNDEFETNKTNCILQSNYSGKTIDKLKEILLEQAKREAIEELYGSVILSKTEILNGRLVSDEVKQKAVGVVRIKGNPKFYNGKNFGEICSDINAYITKKDLKKYSPKIVTLKKFCFNDTSVATKDIKQKAKEKAYIEMITKYKPELKNISLIQAEKFIHEFSISKDIFDLNTGSYCFNARGNILPYELEMIEDFTQNNLSNNGLYITFYKNSDYGLTNEVFETKLSKDISLFNENFTNTIIKEGKAYFIRISGYLYSKKIQHKIFKLESDVNSATLKVNDIVVLNNKQSSGGITLDEGFNKIEIVLNSANSYDIKLMEKIGEGNYLPIKVENLYTRKDK